MEAQVTRARPLEIVFSLLVGLWVIGLTWLVQIVTWVVEQLAIIDGRTLPGWGWPLAVWINALLAGAPAVVLMLASKAPAVRAAGRTWSIAALALGVLGSLRAIPPAQNEIYLAALALAAAVLGGAVLALERDSGRRGVSWLYGLAAGAFVLLPWVWVGSLGGMVETVLAVTAAAAIGFLASTVIGPRFGASYGHRVGGRVMAGLVAAVTFTVLAAGVGGSGLQIAEIGLLTALGFVAAALCQSRVAVAALVGVAVFGPLAFVEPSQTALLVGLHDVGYWALIGTGISLAISGLLALVSIVATAINGRTRRRHVRTGKRLWRPAVAAASALALVAVAYPAVGHPGFHGEWLFVVMKKQADLGGLAQIVDLKERRAETYERLVSTADSTQNALRSKLRQEGLRFTPYYLVNGIEVDAGPEARVWLSRRSDVDRVLLSPQARPIPSAGRPERGNLPAPTGPEWNVRMLNAQQVWDQGDTGKGIVIGSSDSGIDGTHTAISAAFRGGDDSWYDPAGHSRTPVDYNGHGTHTIGSALGSGGIGVAPGAQWMGCVNLARNLGNPPNYLDCLQFLFAPFAFGGNAFGDGRPGDGADVLTNSWGCPTMEGCDARSLQPAIDALTAAGLFVVAAAGNEGPRCGSIDDPPAIYPGSFTVGAVDSDGLIADFSSRGSVTGVFKPDVVAPGVGVVSAMPGGGYAALDGTSMATPQVAGVVALMWSASAKLRGNVTATAKILRSTAVPTTPNGNCPTADQEGGGLVDANAAVYAASTFEP